MLTADRAQKGDILELFRACNSRSAIVAPMISVRQIRAARGFLGWSQSELAGEARLSRSAIARLELEQVQPHPGTIEAICQVLTARGISFADDPRSGLETVELRVLALCWARFGLGVRPPYRIGD
jgi:transcriptional regulator with XRE-family HTH domain